MQISVFKLTYDNWYPSIETVNGAKLVDISFHSGNNRFIVCASGDDDFYFGKEFQADEEKAAWNCFLEIIGQDVVSIEFVRQLFGEY